MNREVCELGIKALHELELIRKTSEDDLALLKEGIGPKAAYAIIDRYWSGEQAEKMKVRVTAQFPKDNGGIILCTSLGEQAGYILALGATKAFFAVAFPRIGGRLEQVFSSINRADLNDPVALEKYNELRKEPARFFEYFANGFFEGKEKVADGEITCWTQLRDHARCVDDGDYLFLDDYDFELKQVKENFYQYYLSPSSIKEQSLAGIDYYTQQLGVRVRLAKLFSCFLDELIEGNLPPKDTE
ncbi:hypothetical protein [Pseudomonas aeruginosa]|uniref:hypothetical protein n=1 Tax=Pseudomonas aeruginosa TaxID=287 RepID=UPI001BD472A8|nr:hypothetical protein [Pseudomonas aeruginosa]MBS9730368.1 hypothetical protein [Pseudomonas aeruginosa]